jgi:hypothetical protein
MVTENPGNATRFYLLIAGKVLSILLRFWQ